MADESTYIIRLVAWLGQAVGGSAPLFAEFSSEDLGLDLPDTVVQAPAVVAALRQAEATAKKVSDTAAELETTATSQEELEILAGFLRFGSALAEFYVALDGLVSAVRGAITPVAVPDAGARADAEDFADLLAKKLSDFVLASAVTDQIPEFGVVLRLAGLLDWRYQPPEAAHDLSRHYVRKTLELDRIKDLIDDPEEHFRNTLGWGSATFDPTDIFWLISDFFDEEDDVEIGVQAGEPFLRIGFFQVTRDSSVAPPGLVLALVAEFSADRDLRTDLTEGWGAGLKSNLRMSGSVSAQVTPPLAFELLPAAGQITGELRAYFDRNEAARPFDLIGGTGILSLSATNATGGVGLKAAWDIAAGRASIDPLLYAEIDGLTLKVGSSGSDSFIGSLLASAEIQGEFDLGLEWQASSGLRIKASGGVEIALPIHKKLGPIEFQTIYLALRILDDGTLSNEVSTALTGTLGPLSASVDRMGVLLDLAFAQGADARFGPFDLDLRFKPPNGVGLAIDAGVVKGGGYLYLDYEKGEYAGALELTVSNWLSLKAIGLINTKLPGGQPGFSLLVIITAEFNPGFQLGYGFVLIGVGGLLGLNRMVLLDPLAQGVRTGAVNSILFPTNIIANAPKILSDLRAIFPPQPNVFLIGPMAKIGWGTPVLISVSLGVIIEIPGNVVILGRLRVALPTDEAAVIVLQVTFIGALEFDKRRIWFFASMYESRVLFITLEGEMGLLMDFSDNPNFVLSVGGFHPRFTAPPLPFPSPKRITLSIVNESWARVRAEAYFAVTSNSVQMGCRLEAYFGFDVLSVEGYFSFDALLRFSPFYLLVEISAGFSVKVFGIGLFGVHLRGSLEGPTPWHITGSAEIEILFFSISVDVDVTFGERRAETLPPIAVLPQLRAEFEKLESWRATLPGSGQFFVSLRELDSPDTLVLHPVGTLQISQRFVPLNLTLDKVGNQKPSDIKKATVAVQAGSLEVKGVLKEKFAAAQYRTMDDAAKLSGPAYESLESGVEVGAAGEPWATGLLAQRNVRYEAIIVDTAFERFRVRFFKFWDGLFTHFRGGAAVAKADISLAHQKKLQPFAEKVAVVADAYSVAFQADNTVFNGSATFGSYAEAQAYLDETLAFDPTLVEEIHVIPQVEVNLVS